MMRRNTAAGSIALGGVFAALAVIIMSLGTLIPIATYACPMLCVIILQLVLGICGSQIAWAWYAAVGILSMLLSTDKEAAATFLFLGYYPIVKPYFERIRLSRIIKGVYFNASIAVMYLILLKVLGLSTLSKEFEDLSRVVLMLLIIMGNFAFFLLDRVLSMDLFRKIGIYGK